MRTSSTTPLRSWFLRRAIRHHNKIQWVGYEGGNALLLWHETSGRIDPSDLNIGILNLLSFEALAALAFFCGSSFIYAYEPTRRPAALFLGSLALIAGGVFLVLAGYFWTGLSVAIASLETARGGLIKLDEAAAMLRAPSKLILLLGRLLLFAYTAPLKVICRRISSIGQVLEERPFLVSFLIKMPLRVEFIVVSFLADSLVGVTVGMLWMVLGDGALALNEEKLKESARRLADSPAISKISRPRSA